MNDLFLIFIFKYLLDIHDALDESLLFHDLFEEIFMFLKNKMDRVINTYRTHKIKILHWL